MAGLLEVKRSEDAGVITLAVEGELDLSTVDEIRGPLSEAANGTPSRVVVDLRRCQFIDSTGLGALLHGGKNLEEAGGAIAIVCKDPQIRRLLELTLIDRTIPVFDDPAEATESVARPVAAD